MRNPGNGTATVATVTMLLTVLAADAALARVVLESRGPRHHRAPSAHEFVLEGGLVEPAGDQSDDFLEHVHRLRRRHRLSGRRAPAPVRRAVISRSRRRCTGRHSARPTGVGDFGPDGLLGYRLETSVIRYGLDLQMYLGEPGGVARPFLTGGLALMHNRYRDESVEGNGSLPASVNTPGLSLGAGLRLGNLELTGEYTWNRFTTGNFDAGRCGPGLQLGLSRGAGGLALGALTASAAVAKLDVNI